MHFLSVRRQTGPESTMKRPAGGRARQRREDREEDEWQAECRLGFHTYVYASPSKLQPVPKISLMGYSVDQVLAPTFPVLACLCFYLSEGK